LLTLLWFKIGNPFSQRSCPAHLACQPQCLPVLRCDNDRSSRIFHICIPLDQTALDQAIHRARDRWSLHLFEFSEDKVSKRSPSTQASYEPVWRLLRDVLGPYRTLSSIGRDEGRLLFETVKALYQRAEAGLKATGGGMAAKQLRKSILAAAFRGELVQ